MAEIGEIVQVAGCEMTPQFYGGKDCAESFTVTAGIADFCEATRSFFGSASGL
jgi:hypothetical protein